MSRSASLVATLIANPAKASLIPSLGIKASAAVNASGLYWLADGIACDIPLASGLSHEEADQALRSSLDDAPVDVVVQEQESRRKKILIADMDSTMIQQECIDELAEEAGLREHVAAITARAMNGEIEFEPALRERVALLKGLPLSVIDKVISTRISLMPGGVELVRTMRKHGAYTALVSGGFTSFTRRVAEMIGFNEDRANTLLHDGAHLSGTVSDPILGREAKVEKLIEIADRLGLTPQDAIAVGDGANDLGMIQLAGTGVALHAKPAVAAQAKVRIDHGDLTALLYIQGYRKSDFVE
ncbi:phosphoserine phosphatase SerB [Ochrobactrum sp. SD129]|jgi:phosphoserine phosphatase|uniref:phosphoserine phosphatase SerB n=1 Tax=Brucella sp. TaxID=52132 RepID=UPI000DD59734|nr:phosphoserine phosphatase SerB [Brucella sp.]MBO1023538.1 phosphoserine phosphatase SerB [Ochrobactrum sp. SD129]